MKSFAYAGPRSESEALGLLNQPGTTTAVLAGGTDLVGLMQADLVAPDRVVDIRRIPEYTGVREDASGLWIGALTTLEELQQEPLLRAYASLQQIAQAHYAIQIQSSGTIGGDVCHLPNCWYYRNGYGLLALQDGESLAATGDNRYHAILGNQGPAKFVNASRFAPGLIAWGAKVRIAGPRVDQEEILPLEALYQSPKSINQGNLILKPGQLVTHIWLPRPNPHQVSAAYEVLQLKGLDWPLAAASATLSVEGGLVRGGRIVMGHVAPTPWLVPDSVVQSLIGKELNEDLADQAGAQAVQAATPLSQNGYKVQLAKTAVKRALLKAVGQWQEGV